VLAWITESRGMTASPGCAVESPCGGPFARARGFLGVGRPVCVPMDRRRTGRGAPRQRPALRRAVRATCARQARWATASASPSRSRRVGRPRQVPSRHAKAWIP